MRVYSDFYRAFNSQYITLFHKADLWEKQAGKYVVI